MTAVKIIGSSVLATSCMTACSYLLSYVTKKNFREPEILAGMIRNVCGHPRGQASFLPTGWLLHYLFGAAWSPVQYSIHLYRKPKTGNPDALLFGACGGIIGIWAWDLMMHRAKYAPPVRKRDFYSQLVVAHLIYSLTLWQLLKRGINDQQGPKPILSLAHNLPADSL
jgi:hypothetical protein